MHKQPLEQIAKAAQVRAAIAQGQMAAVREVRAYQTGKHVRTLEVSANVEQLVQKFPIGKQVIRDTLQTQLLGDAGESPMKAVDRAPLTVKGIGAGLGAALAAALLAGAVNPDLRSTLRNPIVWALVAGSGLGSAGWVLWSKREEEVAGSNAIATTSDTSLPAGSGSLVRMESNPEVHPEFAETTHWVSRHVRSFPPGSPESVEQLKAGGELLRHAANVYQPPEHQPRLEPQDGWQTVAHTEGQNDEDLYRRSSASALPPGASPSVNFPFQPQAEPEALSVTASSDRFSGWGEAEEEEHLDSDRDDDGVLVGDGWDS